MSTSSIGSSCESEPGGAWENALVVELFWVVFSLALGFVAHSPQLKPVPWVNVYYFPVHGILDQLFFVGLLRVECESDRSLQFCGFSVWITSPDAQIVF